MGKLSTKTMSRWSSFLFKLGCIPVKFTQYGHVEQAAFLSKFFGKHYFSRDLWDATRMYVATALCRNLNIIS